MGRLSLIWYLSFWGSTYFNFIAPFATCRCAVPCKCINLGRERADLLGLGLSINISVCKLKEVYNVTDHKLINMKLLGSFLGLSVRRGLCFEKKRTDRELRDN